MQVKLSKALLLLFRIMIFNGLLTSRSTGEVITRWQTVQEPRTLMHYERSSQLSYTITVLLFTTAVLLLFHI